MKQLTKQQLFEFFNANKKHIKRYQKRGIFIARPAIAGETILTIVAGKLETLKTASENDIVVRNIEIGGSAETYIIPLDVYSKRYEETSTKYNIDGKQWAETKAKGLIDAFQYTGDEELNFEAPWLADGKPVQMYCEPNDYIGRAVGTDDYNIYRIEFDTFTKTYFDVEL